MGGSLGFGVAFGAGLLSFLSPCVLPLVPSYATFITGMGLDQLAESRPMRERHVVLVHGLLFVLGFSAVFLILGASATFLGSLFGYARGWIERAGGALLIVFALYLLGLLRIPGAQREWRVHFANKPVGYFGTLLVGVTFGAGWTPCIGPTLGGILTLAGTRGSVSEGTGLLAMYSLGLALPFLAATLLLDHFLHVLQRFRRWLPWVNRASGALLLAVGVLLITGSFSSLAALLAGWTPDLLLERL